MLYLIKHGEKYKVSFGNCVDFVEIDFDIRNVISTLYIGTKGQRYITLDVENSPLEVIKTIFKLYNILLIKQNEPADNIKGDILINSSNIEDLKQELKEFKKEYDYFKEKVWSVLY